MTIETDDPDVEVVVKGDRIVRIRDPKSGREYTLDRTDLTFGEDGDGVQVTLDGTKPVVLKRSGKAFATVRLVPKPVAVAEPWGEIFRTAWADTGHVSSLTFAPDGKNLFVGRGNGEGRVYDLGAKAVRVELPQAWIGWYLPGGDSLLIAEGERRLAVVDALTGRSRREFAPHRDERVRSMHLAPTGDTAITWSDKGVARLWDVATGKLLQEWYDRGVSYSPIPGELVLSREINAPDAVWDIATGRERPAPKAYSRFVGLANGVSERFGPDRLVAWVGQALMVYNRADGKLLHTVDMGSGMDRLKHRGLGIGPGGRFVVHTAEDTATAVVREVATGKELARLKLGGTGVAYQCAVSADGTRVAVANQFGEIAVWELAPTAGAPQPPRPAPAPAVQTAPPAELTPTRVLTGQNKPRAVVVAPDGARAHSSGYDYTIRVWDPATGKEVRRIADAAEPFDALALSPDGSKVFASTRNNNAVLLDAATGTVLAECKGHTQVVACLAISANGKTGLTGGHDNTVRLWNLGTGKELKVLTGHTGPVRGVAFLPGNRAVSGAHDRTVRVWDLDTGKVLKQFDPLNGWALGLAVHPNGERVVVNSASEAVAFDVDTGQVVRRFAGHTTNVHAVAVSPDGRLLATGGFDKTVRIWEFDTGRCVAVGRGHTGYVVSVAFAGERTLLSAGDDTLRVWTLPREGAPPPPRAVSSR